MAQGKAVQLITTLGSKSFDDLGMILPHEHLFVDLGPIEAESYRHATPEAVIPVMGPELEKIAVQGITALVECTPVGVGRRADIDVAVSHAVDFPVVLPTGVYREPWVPDWVRAVDEDALTEWMIGELTEGIEATGVPAAWIKVSAGDDGLTDVERKILRAAARAGAATNAVIGSHTIRGWVVEEQLDIIEAAGYSPARFIWIHTQAEPDSTWYGRMGERGAWLEFDAIGSSSFSDDWFVGAIRDLMAAGFGDQLLLSQDRGWYDPSKPGGGEVKPFTYFADTFLPALRDGGFTAQDIEQLTRANPFHAYAR